MTKKVVLKIVIIAFAFLLFIPTVNAASKATTIKELKDELAALKTQKAKNDSAKKQTENEISNKKNAIYNAYQEQESIKVKVQEAKNKIAESEIKIKEAKEEINIVLRTLQISNGENALLEWISGAKDTTELILRQAIAEQISKYNHDSLKKLNDLIIENQNLQVELSNREIELNEKIENYSAAISSLGNQVTELNEINEDINDQIKNQTNLINYYKTVCSSETQKLSDCVKVSVSGGFRKPLVKGTITSYWGYRFNPLTGSASSFHNALDIGGNAEGTKVYAAASGMVAAITVRSSCGGNAVYIHNNINGVAYTTQYMHLLSYNVKVGDVVTPDTVIGYVGGGASTRSYDKCSTGAHLHFGISKGYYLGGGSDGYSTWAKFISNSVDPRKYISFPNKGSWFYSRG